uniref:Uncharacterized protein n=1 Tax=Panagrolaimus sp. JU765 TaxID=591449 RepID=A0AC34Q8J5_9BILA
MAATVIPRIRAIMEAATLPILVTTEAVTTAILHIPAIMEAATILTRSITSQVHQLPATIPALLYPMRNTTNPVHQVTTLALLQLCHTLSIIKQVLLQATILAQLLLCLMRNITKHPTPATLLHTHTTVKHTRLHHITLTTTPLALLRQHKP